MTQKMWMVRAGRNGRYLDDFIEHDLIAIGWGELGPLHKNMSRPEILKQYQQAFPENSKAKASHAVGQVARFVGELEIGDEVITYDRETRLYYLGAIQSDCIYEREFLMTNSYRRQVEWTHTSARDELTTKVKNALGSISTLFLVRKDAAKALREVAFPIGTEREERPQRSRPAEIEAEETLAEEQSRAELLEKAEEAIEDKIARLDWEEMQELVAGILRAMGYRTTVSPRGADRGVDIFASPDGLGLEEPRIFVEVKHRPNSTMGANDLRSFLGGRSPGDRCLYVSTGGFTKDARYEADRSTIPLRLLTLVDLRRLLVENYEDMDEVARGLVPLRRTYVVAMVTGIS